MGFQLPTSLNWWGNTYRISDETAPVLEWVPLTIHQVHQLSIEPRCFPTSQLHGHPTFTWTYTLLQAISLGRPRSRSPMPGPKSFGFFFWRKELALGIFNTSPRKNLTEAKGTWKNIPQKDIWRKISSLVVFSVTLQGRFLQSKLLDLT